MRTNLFWILAIYFAFTLPSYAFENLFYIMRSTSPGQMTAAQTAFESMNSHPHAIDILSPQSYQIDSNGMVWGFVDTEVLEFSNKNNVKLMPLITNAGFDKVKVHDFLTNKEAQQRALDTLLQICKQGKFYGLQLDFEMVPLADRNALTQFYRAAADLLHKNGYKISFAVAPVFTEGPLPSEFLKKVYENWQGAYDLKALGQFGDFVTVMAYNQHAGKTTPGPTASITWDEAIIKFILTLIPADKISLGVALYSEYWSTTPNLDDPLKKVEAHSVGLSYTKATNLANKHHATLQWDDRQKNYFAVYENNWLNEYLFFEDARSFKEKILLAKKYNLRGISAFCIGVEDPAIWKQLGTAIN